jgi:hypothetical protein
MLAETLLLQYAAGSKRAAKKSCKVPEDLKGLESEAHADSDYSWEIKVGPENSGFRR